MFAVRHNKGATFFATSFSPTTIPAAPASATADRAIMPYANDISLFASFISLSKLSLLEFVSISFMVRNYNAVRLELQLYESFG